MLVAITIVSFGLFCTYFCWAPFAALLFVAKQYKLPPSPRALFYWLVLKWPSLLGILGLGISSYLDYHTLNTPDMWLLLFMLVYWVAFRNVGRQDPPQRKRRVRARLKQVGGRLVLVPENA